MSIPHMLAHTVLITNIGVPSVLVGWECITPADISIAVKVFDKVAFGARKELWRRQFLESGVEQLKKWLMSLHADNDLSKCFEWFVDYYDLYLMPVKPPVRRNPRKKKNLRKKLKICPSEANCHSMYPVPPVLESFSRFKRFF